MLRRLSSCSSSLLTAPDGWVETYDIASGPRQSPINIPISCECDLQLQSVPLFCEYETRGKLLINTGQGFQVNFDGFKDSCGPLDSKYRLEQLHCHWGKDNSIGSEHTIDGKTYPSEMHLVHWNYEKYANIDEATDKPDGLAVIGIFLEVGEEHPELEKVCELLPNVPYRGDEFSIEAHINPAKFIPENKTYWTYPGSMTIPPYLESVQWIVFKSPIQVSEQQLETFRAMLNYGRQDEVPEDECGGKTLNNHRQTLDLGSRTVRSCICEN